MSFSVGVPIELTILMRGLSANERENFYAASGLPDSAITQALRAQRRFFDRLPGLQLRCGGTGVFGQTIKFIGHPTRRSGLTSSAETGMIVL